MTVFAMAGKWEKVLDVLAKLGNRTLGEVAGLEQMNIEGSDDVEDNG